MMDLLAVIDGCSLDGFWLSDAKISHVFVK
jgi:hypothetical protein